MVATTKRHPAIVRHRTGVTRDGRLTAMDIDAVFDGGAYATLSAVVLSRGVIHASGPYRCDHVRIRGRAMMTNTPPNGAFRGFGAPQTQFAVEVHMDRIADGARHRSGARSARSTRCGRATRPPPASGSARTAARCRCCAKRCSGPTSQKRRQRDRAARSAGDGNARGIGLVAVLSRLRVHRRRRDQARVEGVARAHRARRADPRREHRDRPGHAHDARADRRRHARHPVRLRRRQRRRHRGGARQRADGRVAHLHGRRPHPAALRRGDAASGSAGSRRASICATHGPLVDHARSTSGRREMAWDDDSYQGDAYGSYGWGCDVVELEVDRDTWEVRPIALHDGARDRQGDSSRCWRPGRSKAAARRGSATRCSRTS